MMRRHMPGGLAKLALAALATAVTTPAWSDSLYGTTIRASYSLSWQRCELASGVCSEIPQVSFDSLMYVSSKGEVYDYSSNRQGEIFKPGEPKLVNGSMSSFRVSGSRLVSKATRTGNLGKLTTNLIFIANGGSCRISADSIMAGYRLVPTVNVGTCSVQSGHQER